MSAQSYRIKKPAASACAERKEMRKGFAESFYAQFRKPTGFWGSVAGWLMAHRPSNRERNRWTLSLLDLKPADRVLEIGFGPGVAIQEIRQLAPQGLIAGIDYSEVMVRQARRRNAAAMRAGRVDLRLASVSEPPAIPELFDKIFSANSVQFWPDPVENLKQLRRLLKPGGRIAITYQPRHRGATQEDAQRMGEQVVRNLQAAGFSRVRLETRNMQPVSVVCALGHHIVQAGPESVLSASAVFQNGTPRKILPKIISTQ